MSVAENTSIRIGIDRIEVTYERVTMKKKVSKKQRKQTRQKRLIAVCVGVTVILLCFLGYMGLKTNDPSSDGENSKVEKSTEEFDKGRLKLVGSVEYEGPDFENGTMENQVHTLLKIQNISESFLRNAVIEVEVNKTEKMQLVIDSLPAGETVMAIGHGYDSFAEQDVFKVISCESSYEEQVTSEKEGVTVTFENGKIQIQNQSAEDYSGLILRYKGKVGNLLMGGNTYELTVDSLAPGSSYEADSQCFLAESIQVVEFE